MLNAPSMLSEEHFLPQLHLPLGLPSPWFCTMSAVVDKEVRSRGNDVQQ
jgi:hypothetical protein